MDDAVAGRQERGPMGHGQHRPIAGEMPHRPGNGSLTRRVEMRRGLIEQHQGGVAQKRTGQGKPLTLPG